MYIHRVLRLKNSTDYGLSVICTKAFNIYIVTLPSSVSALRARMHEKTWWVSARNTEAERGTTLFRSFPWKFAARERRPTLSSFACCNVTFHKKPKILDRFRSVRLVPPPSIERSSSNGALQWRLENCFDPEREATTDRAKNVASHFLEQDESNSPFASLDTSSGPFRSREKAGQKPFRKGFEESIFRRR